MKHLSTFPLKKRNAIKLVFLDFIVVFHCSVEQSKVGKEREKLR
jgi:hypothetical protein